MFGTRTAVRRYVTPGRGVAKRYMDLLHGNFLDRPEPERSQFTRSLARAAKQITDEELHTLLDSEWRARLTASWLIGLDRRSQFRSRIGELLLASELVYAGQGYCFSLARFEDTTDAALLVAYLDRYLPRLNCQYDQHWAIGALLRLDERLGTSHAARFLAPDGLWQHSAMKNQDPAEWQERIVKLCSIADVCMTRKRFLGS
ncbi:DUF6000 family protein [Streptosporangium canum]|uniref:DUF6000 family protein n=1 Tax=Streptosporangium canum TaxID=324952 RepID=UPI00378E40D3